MTSHQMEIIVLAALSAVSCSLCGVFLVLRRVALMSDAISHSILLGIVLSFFYTKNLSSPLLILSAALTGVLTVILTEGIIQSRKLKKDAAIGLVFPLLFSIGVILLNLYAGDIHLDTDCVIFGEIAFAPFDRWLFHGIDLGPKGLWTSGGIALMNIFFITLFYKELKITTFDPGLAVSLGFSSAFINYTLMTMVSLTAVGAFQNIGSVLVVALMIAPPSAAYLLTDRLSHMIYFSIVIGILSAAGGYVLAHVLDINIAGSMATFSGIIFLHVLFLAPEKGLLAKWIVKKWKKWDFASETLAVHLLQAETAHSEETESIVTHMSDHMLWDSEFTSEVIAQGIKEGVIKKEGHKLFLTSYGREKAKHTMGKG